MGQGCLNKIINDGTCWSKEDILLGAVLVPSCSARHRSPICLQEPHALS